MWDEVAEALTLFTECSMQTQVDAGGHPAKHFLNF